MTVANPIRVSAIGARLTEDLVPGRCNYGQLQVTFDDGSVGWYEAGWGPMMSETAYFIKDVIGPGGSVSIVRDLDGARSDDIQGHTRTDCLRLHRSRVDSNGEFTAPDEIIRFEDEPDHDALCEREQAFLARAIREDLDLSEHLRSAVDSLRIVLAAEQSIRTGRTVHLA
jgi:predicted dehydrogenase